MHRLRRGQQRDRDENTVYNNQVKTTLCLSTLHTLWPMIEFEERKEKNTIVPPPNSAIGVGVCVVDAIAPAFVFGMCTIAPAVPCFENIGRKERGEHRHRSHTIHSCTGGSRSRFQGMHIQRYCTPQPRLTCPHMPSHTTALKTTLLRKLSLLTRTLHSFPATLTSRRRGAHCL